MRKTSMLRAVFVGALALSACGDSTSGDGDGGDGGTGGNGGTAGGGTGCAEGNGGDDMTSCTQKEQDDYAACLQTACVPEQKKCLGDEFQSGKFGGLCGSYQECITDCDCDTNCIQKCPLPSMECTTCLQEMGGCINTACPLPACYTAGATTGGGSDKTCADVKACCDAKADMATRDQCNQTYMALMAGGDAACSAAYPTLCM